MKKCDCTYPDWKRIWFGALKEEGHIVTLFQCSKCKTVEMDRDD